MSRIQPKNIQNMKNRENVTYFEDNQKRSAWDDWNAEIIRKDF